MFFKKSLQRIRLEVDGGIKIENVASLAACGADTFVVGSGIFDHRDSGSQFGYKKIMESFRNQLTSAL